MPPCGGQEYSTVKQFKKGKKMLTFTERMINSDVIIIYILGKTKNVPNNKKYI